MSEILERHREFIEKCRNRAIPKPKTREQLIQEKIADKYNIGAELALINNYNLYLKDNTLEQYKREYDDYTAFRTKVKIETNGEGL